ncbi:MAG: sigma-54 dependent transcriptional regulator [Desulfobacteraceae bacterium]|jgi:two-component system NtrC family response regulator|nr:sigma-54 dependent transcriptional regulator [Desulfobacteraceae bacterium]
MDTILVVDDEKNYTRILCAVLADEGYETVSANSGADAIATLQDSEVDLVLTDMKMPGMDGIQLLQRIKEKDPDLPVIMMTAHGTVDKAVEAMQKGAYTYIQKPFDNNRLIIFVERAIDMYRVLKENRRLRHVVESQYRFDNIVGKSRPMREIFQIIQKVAPTQATVLIEGESGTGKELVAKSIHFNSPRRERPFVAVNCSALAESLLESELFGHEKGAFTGATSTRKGRFELADKGTLLLDEIGELSQGLQVKLLRVLQEKTFERVGGANSISVDFRLIAATNKNLKKEVQRGRFRSDLFYRLNVVNIPLPLLRERQEDIRLLIEHFIKKFNTERIADRPVLGIDPEAERMLYGYAWPGNVRELENVIERAMVMCSGDVIRVSDLPRDFRETVTEIDRFYGIPENAKLQETLESIEKRMISRALRMCNNVQSDAAAMLGIGKSGFNKKLKKYGLN